MDKAHYSSDPLNRDWPGRAELFRLFNGELDQEMVDQVDRAHTPRTLDDQ